MFRKNLLLAGLMFATGVTLADYQPPLGQGPATPAAPTQPSANQTANNGGGMASGVSSPYWNQSSDLPAADIRAVPPAVAQAVQAKWTFNQTQDDLSYALRVNQMQFDLRPDVVAAVREERAAYDNLQKERARALSSLNDNAAYTGANQLQANLTQQIADERDADHPNPDRLSGMATVRLNYVQDNRKLEASVLARDDGYQKARQRYIEAATRVREMRQAEALAVMTDPNLTSLRRQVADARIAKLTTAAYRDATLGARNVALDYAGYYRRTGYLNNGFLTGYYGGYPYYGYGSGFRY